MIKKREESLETWWSSTRVAMLLHCGLLEPPKLWQQQQQHWVGAPHKGKNEIQLSRMRRNNWGVQFQASGVAIGKHWMNLLTYQPQEWWRQGQWSCLVQHQSRMACERRWHPTRSRPRGSWQHRCWCWWRRWRNQCWQHKDLLHWIQPIPTTVALLLPTWATRCWVGNAPYPLSALVQAASQPSHSNSPHNNQQPIVRNPKKSSIQGFLSWRKKKLQLPHQAELWH